MATRDDRIVRMGKRTEDTDKNIQELDALRLRYAQLDLQLAKLEPVDLLAVCFASDLICSQG